MGDKTTMMKIGATSDALAKEHSTMMTYDVSTLMEHVKINDEGLQHRILTPINSSSSKRPQDSSYNRSQLEYGFSQILLLEIPDSYNNYMFNGDNYDVDDDKHGTYKMKDDSSGYIVGNDTINGNYNDTFSCNASLLSWVNRTHYYSNVDYTSDDTLSFAEEEGLNESYIRDVTYSEVPIYSDKITTSFSKRIAYTQTIWLLIF